MLAECSTHGAYFLDASRSKRGAPLAAVGGPSITDSFWETRNFRPGFLFANVHFENLVSRGVGEFSIICREIVGWSPKLFWSHLLPNFHQIVRNRGENFRSKIKPGCWPIAFDLAHKGSFSLSRILISGKAVK